MLVKSKKKTMLWPRLFKENARYDSLFNLNRFAVVPTYSRIICLIFTIHQYFTLQSRDAIKHLKAEIVRMQEQKV